MNLRSLGNAVSKRPLTVAIIILVITLLFGFYASQMQISADLKTFLPNDKMINADEKISDEFGDTDLMELIFISNNTVSKSTMNDMLKVESSLINDSVVSKNLKTPDNPGNSIISPADLIIMGNLTLKFEMEMENILKNTTNTLENINFTVISMPLATMNRLMNEYRDIYLNASSIGDDAKNLILIMFMPPGENESAGNLTSMKTLLDNITYALLTSSDFNIKSRILTLLTPPLSGNTSSNMSMEENPLFNYFLNDMNSNMSMDNKTTSLHYFILSNNYSYISLNYSNASLLNGIEGNEGLLDSLNYTEWAITNGQNSTALEIVNETIDNVTAQASSMHPLDVLYESYNQSLSKFMYDYYTGNLSLNDIKSVQENTTYMIQNSSGDWKNMLIIFNDTFNKWIKDNHIYYDMIYEMNNTQEICEGYNQTYRGLLLFRLGLIHLKLEINNAPISQTISDIENMKEGLMNSTSSMKMQKSMIENLMVSMKSPMAMWFVRMLGDMEYVILNSPNDSQSVVNIFNYEMSMMNTTSSSNSSIPTSFTTVFYSLKHAFDSDVADNYKYEIQNIFLTEMNMMNMNMSFSFNLSMNMEMPQFNMNPNIEEKRNMLNNMSYSDITNTIKNIENYDPREISDAVNKTSPVIENTSENMSMVNDELANLIYNINFVYNTTGDEGVKDSLKFYKNISGEMSLAFQGLKSFESYLPQIGGFGYAMEKMSEQLSSMFSKDFNGNSAKASLMLVMLNSTYKDGETTKQHSDRMEKLEQRVEDVAKNTDTQARIRAMGYSLISKATEKTSNETMNVLLPVSVVLIIIILAITFRSIVDTLLGLLGLGMAIVWAYGFGVLAGYQFNQILTTVAVLLVGLGIDYAIHTILRYREELRKGENVRDAMNEMITHLGMGLILATITSMVAFLSNISSPIPPIASFGVMNAVGIFGAFVIFTTFIPGVKILIDERREKKGKLKIKKEEKREGSGVIILNKFMALGAVAAEKHRYTVLGIIILISIGAIYGGMNLGTTFDVKDFLPSNLEISNTITYMMDNFNSSGMSDNYILIEGNITGSDALVAVDKTFNNMKDDKFVIYSQSYSPSSLIKEWKEKNSTFAKMVNENDINNDGLPDKNISEVYNWLYQHTDEGKSILHKSSNGNFDSMLILVRSNASTDKEDRILYDDLKKDIQPLTNVGLSAIPTGTNLLTFHILDMIEGTQWNSLVITLIVSLIVLEIIFLYERRSYILGIITMLPVAISLLWILGTMYLLNINFNVVTVTVTSLTIGLGITYAIHITHRFLEDWDKEKSIEDAIRKTLRHTGTSIFGAATTTMAGFGTLILSSMPPIRQFGEVAFLSIFYSFVLSVFILPTFLYFWAKWRERKGEVEKIAGTTYVYSSVIVMIIGSLIYGLAFYLRWSGWKMINSPSSFLIAILGVVIILVGGEIYYKGKRKNGKL